MSALPKCQCGDPRWSHRRVGIIPDATWLECEHCGCAKYEPVAEGGVPEPAPDDRTDRLYGKLHSAREALCVAQMLVPPYWSSDLQVALDIIDQAGSSCCPQQWSRHDQPEYPERRRG